MADSCTTMFEETFYPRAFLKLADKTIEAFEEQQEEIIKEWKDGIKNYLSELEALQKEKLAPEVSELHFSFLYTSLLSGEPKFRIDTYGEGGRLSSESILTEEISALWLGIYFEEFRQELEEYTVRESIRRFIRPAELEVLKLRAVRSLLYYFSSRFRYIAPDILDFRELAKIKKEDSFVIQMGEYMDWQKTLYALLPEVDIFNCDRNTLLSFRRFSAFYYQDKVFSGLKVDNARFLDCTFKDVVIENCRMNDSMFAGCVFENTVFRNTEMAGCLFLDCTIKNSVWEQVEFLAEGRKAEMSENYEATSENYEPTSENYELTSENYEPTSENYESTSESYEPTSEYYEPAEFYRCSLEDCRFTGCGLSECSVGDCDMEKVVIKDSRTENSGFLEQEGILWADLQEE